MISGYFGKSNSGKTYLLKKHIKKYKNNIIFDINNEYNISNKYDINDVDNIIKAYFNNDLPLSIIPVDINQEVIYFIYKYVKNVNIIIEDIDIYKNTLFDKIITVSRHKNVSIYYTCRRPQNISKLLLFQTNNFYIFNTVESNTLKKYIEFGFNIDKIKKLKKYQYVVYKY